MLALAFGTTVATTALAAFAVYKWWKAETQMIKIREDFTSERSVHIQLLHNYGNLGELKYLKNIIPKVAENLHKRIAEYCVAVCVKYSVPQNRILDAGSGVGALSFYLSQNFREVIATDTSYEMIVAANQLKQFNEFAFPFPFEGGKHIGIYVAKVPEDSVKDNVTFWDEDVCALVHTCGMFDCVVILNTLTHLGRPKNFLLEIGDYVPKGGILIIADSYDWHNGPEEALETDKVAVTLHILMQILNPKWELREETEMPFYIPKCQRLAILGSMHVSVWQRKPEPEEV
ncbi:uncharacterized protein LOC143040343 [Oratosquilla oratoria]|uniref:uncharacterized protein LOC143040343 n=1 Tax=Oratosquilla oratoria TaxID=337810 RepID=UPI003F75B3B4